MRALRLSEEAKPCLKKVADPAVISAVAYLRARKTSRCKTRRASDGTGLPTDEHIDKSFTIRTGDDSLLRGELEARILAKQTDAEIGKRCGLDAGVIAWYASLFFDVRPRIEAMDWLVRNVIGRPDYDPYGKHELARLWARHAWARGPVVLDFLVDAFRRARRRGEPPTLAVYLRRGVPLGLQAMVAGYLLPLEADAWLIEFHLRSIEAEAVADPVVLGEMMDEMHRETICIAKLVLKGNPLPEPPSRKVSRRSPHTTRDRSRKQTSGGSAAGTPDVVLGMVDSHSSGGP